MPKFSDINCHIDHCHIADTIAYFNSFGIIRCKYQVCVLTIIYARNIPSSARVDMPGVASRLLTRATYAQCGLNAVVT